MQHSRIWLFAWLVGILFPMAWLGRFSAIYHHIFNVIFSPEWIHWLIHTALFCGLAVLILLAFDLPTNRRTILIILAITLIVGIIQEGAQLLAGVQVLSWNSILDLSIDAGGALLGMSIIFLTKNLPKRI